MKIIQLDPVTPKENNDSRKPWRDCYSGRLVAEKGKRGEEGQGKGSLLVGRGQEQGKGRGVGMSVGGCKREQGEGGGRKADCRKKVDLFTSDSVFHRTEDLFERYLFSFIPLQYRSMFVIVANLFFYIFSFFIDTSQILTEALVA